MPPTAFTVGGVPTSDEEILEMILAHEGGIFTNHPNDHGGPTKWGITQKALERWRGHPVTIDDVRNLSREEACDIYRAWHIKPYEGVVGLVRVNVIDMSVNAGVPRATMLLQQTVGVTVDGVMGPNTRAAAQLRDWNGIYTGVRIGFYESIIKHDPSQIVFRNGWRARALSFLADAQGRPRLRLPRMGLLEVPSVEPVYGFTGKAY